MSGIIAFAVFDSGHGKSVRMDKRKKESDLHFLKTCKRYVATHGEKNILKRDVTRKGFSKNEIRYFNKSESDITERISELYAG